MTITKPAISYFETRFVMKKSLVIVFLLINAAIAKSQNLVVEGTAPDLYIIHTVAPRENFYSVGRLYNQAAKSIAAFNNIAMEKGLTIGQRIKIPLNEQNLEVTGKANSGEGLIPLTHIVSKSETISKIGADHKVSAQMLRQWNNLSSDNIAPGTPLVVGHLKMPPTAASARVNSSSTGNEAVASKKEMAAEPKEIAVAPKKEETFNSIATTLPADQKESASTVQQERAKPSETTGTTVQETSETGTGQEVSKEKPTKASVVKTDETTAKRNETRKTENYSYSSALNLGSIEGVFASVFTTDGQKSINSKSGEAATFKSTSGWQDKKYYVLMNDVAPGTILKIESMENKIVYAKVLGSMPEMKENNGLLLRISNAAASYLGIIDPRFPVRISYYQ